MIDRVTLRDFKTHMHTELSLGALTLLVGPNGSGKTSVLQAINMLGQIHYKSSDKLFQPQHGELDLVRHADEVNGFVVGVKGSQGRAIWELELEASMDHTLGYDEYGNTHDIITWPALVRGKSGTEMDWSYEYGPSLVQQGRADWWIDLRRAMLLRLDARQIARVSPAAEETYLGFDGSGAATTIANLQLTDPARVEAITEQLRHVVPHVRRVGAVPATVQVGEKNVAGYRLVFDFVGGRDVSAGGVSEGTLLVLALTTLLQTRQCPRVLLLDDLDAGLHPTAQGRLMEMLQTLTTGPDAIQIVATTHSPYILDRVPPEAVQVFALREDGTTAVKCLAQHPEAKAFRGALSAGELWTLDDEQNWVVAAPVGEGDGADHPVL